MKNYLPVLSASVNRKGVLDVDSVKGCSLGMAKYPDGGCYGLCYAAKMAAVYGYDFSKSVSRQIGSNTQQIEMFANTPIYGSKAIASLVKRHDAAFFRIGTMGDPCHDWQLTAEIAAWLGQYKTPVIITKHWVELPDSLIPVFAKVGAVFNTSISALDAEDEISHRLRQFDRLWELGLESVLRVVSCKFGNTATGRRYDEIQRKLFENSPVIDNPLRIPATDERVLRGDVLVDRRKDLQATASVSVAHNTAYLGRCKTCPDQCGLTKQEKRHGTRKAIH